MKKLLLLLLSLSMLSSFAHAAGPAPSSFTTPEPAEESATKYRWPALDYTDLLRNPDSYAGNDLYYVEGTVLGVSESKYGDFQFGSGTTDVIVCLQPNEEDVTPIYLHYFRKFREPRILEGDYVTANVASGGLSVYWDYSYPFTDELPFFFAFIMTVNGEDYPQEK